jgi:hypothetical protein
MRSDCTLGIYGVWESRVWQGYQNAEHGVAGKDGSLHHMVESVKESQSNPEHVVNSYD